MTDKIELKPCPFCGGNAEIIDDAMGTISRCRCCGAENGNGVYGAEGHKLAVKDWNTRPIEDELRKELRYYRNYCAALEKEVITLRDALTFYAELDGNGIQLYGEMDSKALEFIDGASFPFGQTARDALKGGAE